jgi:pimeloyl-ACP methyl ester carboxylesterase
MASAIRPGASRSATARRCCALWRVVKRYLGQDLPGASHWVHRHEHERVNQLLIDFLARTPPPS